jgi:hypothetical protein
VTSRASSTTTASRRWRVPTGRESSRLSLSSAGCASRHRGFGPLCARPARIRAPCVVVERMRDDVTWLDCDAPLAPAPLGGGRCTCCELLQP